MEWEDAVLPPKAHKAINVEKERKPKAENKTKPNTGLKYSKQSETLNV